MGWIPGEMPLARSEVIAAAAESLFWLSVLDEVEGARLGRDRYRALREADPNGQLLIGLLWARHSVAHGAVVVQDGSVWSRSTVMMGPDGPQIVGPTQQKHALRWRRLADISVTNRARELRPYYERQVAGRWVDETLAAAQQWLTNVSDV